MQETLYIENFGPIKKATLDLRQAMVFIGPQSSGKSTIAKLVSIMRDWQFVNNHKSFDELIAGYNMKNYITGITKISYKSSNYSFGYEINVGSLVYHIENKWGKLEKEISEDGKFNLPLIKDKTKDIRSRQKTIESLIEQIAIEENPQTKAALMTQAKEMLSVIDDEIEIHNKNIGNSISALKEVTSYSNYSAYIPAERLLISLYSGSTLSFLNNKLPIPQTIIEFGDAFQKARATINELTIPFLTYKFVHKDGEDFIVSDNIEIDLKNASSGLQALLPLILVVNRLSLDSEIIYSYIIEEPEQNLYPKTQKDLIYYLSSKCLQYSQEMHRSSDLIITTHSPYTLTSFNNLLFAYQVAKKKDKEEVAKIIAEESWVNPNEFNAYFVADGTVREIFNRETGLIDENELDSASEEIMGDFEELMEIYKGIKA